MAAVVQQLRTTDASKIPAGLEPGQIAFNLAAKFMFVGVGGADILVRGVALATYGNTQTISGQAGVNVPAKPAAGKGYEIFDLEGSGVSFGTADPATGTKGELFVNTSGAPVLKIYSGSAWNLAIPTPTIKTATDVAVQALGGADANAKIKAWMTANAAGYRPSAGDTFIATDGGSGAQAVVKTGSYIFDGANWVSTGGASLPDATARAGTANTGTGGSKGVVYLARNIDVLPAGAAGAVTPDPLAVATAAQLKATNAQIAALQGGTALLGTYDASASSISTVGPEATVGGRGGLAVGAKLSAGTGLHAGDYFIVHKAGTIAGESAGINAAVNSGDTLIYNGSAWSVLATGPIMAGLTLHGCTDVSDAAVGTVTAANVKGFLVRDGSVAADGTANAYKLVNVLDLGTFAVIIGLGTAILSALQGAQVV